MSGSVNTNIGAMVALRNLQDTNNALSATQKRISTGLRVADAYDDGASYAVATALRSDIGALGAVNERLAVGKGMIDVAVKASENIATTMGKLNQVLVKLSDESLSTDDRTNYNTEFTALKTDIDNFIKDAKYNGVNLLNTAGTSQNVISNVSGDTITVRKHDLEADVSGTLGAAPADAAAAKTLLTGGFKTAMTNLKSAQNELGSDARRVDNQISFNNSIADATNTGLGAIVDADLAKESAKMQSLQVKQQLGTQSLSIANQAPQSLLSLFR